MGFSQKLLSAQVLVTTASVIVGLIVLWLFRFDLKGVAAILWPSVVAATIFFFRTELGELLKRLKRVGATGAEFSEATIAAQITASAVDQILPAVAPGETQPSFVRGRIEALRVELNARQPDDRDKRESLLLLRLAEAQQARDHLTTWINLFLSQLEALSAMAGATGPIDLTPYFDAHVQRREALPLTEGPLRTITFDLWCTYFGRMRLATITGREGTITEEGHGLPFFFAARFNLPRFHVV